MSVNPEFGSSLWTASTSTSATSIRSQSTSGEWWMTGGDGLVDPQDLPPGLF